MPFHNSCHCDFSVLDEFLSKGIFLSPFFQTPWLTCCSIRHFPVIFLSNITMEMLQYQAFSCHLSFKRHDWHVAVSSVSCCFGPKWSSWREATQAWLPSVTRTRRGWTCSRSCWRPTTRTCPPFRSCPRWTQPGETVSACLQVCRTAHPAGQGVSMLVGVMVGFFVCCKLR